ncbi:uncharacterized protein LOC143021682 isoform X1 [Oratosquilla oratoria]|uniref:uncharacterized protein LOC143021682 isoform X1 n=1 Tax=Oratosquilla oratoria TaxID=337810 RepID=UPI003F7712D0
MKPRITYTSVTGLITPLHHTSTTTWHYDYHTTPTAPHRITTATTTTTTTTTPGPVTQCRPDSRRGSWPGWSHGVIIVVLWWCERRASGTRRTSEQSSLHRHRGRRDHRRRRRRGRSSNPHRIFITPMNRPVRDVVCELRDACAGWWTSRALGVALA